MARGDFLGAEGHLQLTRATQRPVVLRTPPAPPAPVSLGSQQIPAHEMGSVLCSRVTHTEEEIKHEAEYAV